MPLKGILDFHFLPNGHTHYSTVQYTFRQKNPDHNVVSTNFTGKQPHTWDWTYKDYNYIDSHMFIT